MTDQISLNTKNRLPFYLEYLYKVLSSGQTYISSKAIANALDLGEVQVRKDLAAISTGGKPKVGYEISLLIQDLESFLGFRQIDDAVIFGAGKLGVALLDYPGFLECGLNIVGAFDVSKDKQGTSEGGKFIRDNNEFIEFNKDHKIEIGLLCVPARHAQEVCDFMVKNGIKAILNFAPAHLIVPDDVTVKTENLAYSLALLTIEMRNKNKTLK